VGVRFFLEFPRDFFHQLIDFEITELDEET
jgi:hypothetical protein